MAEHSRYQQRIIKNYYQNQPAILLQKLQELVTKLYLGEGSAKQQWKQAATSLEKLGVPASRIEHVIGEQDPARLAKLVEELMAKG